MPSIEQNIQPRSIPLMPPTTASLGNVFDGSQFKIQIGEDLDAEVIESLQKEFGQDMAGAIDKFFDMKQDNDLLSHQLIAGDGPGKLESDDDNGSADPLGRKQIITKDHYWDKVNRRHVVRKPAPTRKASSHAKLCVIYALRKYSDNMTDYKTELQILGPALRNALQNIFRGSEGFTLTENENTTISPEFLYWAAPELKILARHYESINDRIAQFEINSGLEFVKSHFEDMVSILPSLLPHSITFEYLWSILPPDCLVVGLDTLGFTRVWRVRSHAIKTSNCGTSLNMQCEMVEWNGTTMGYAERGLDIPYFDGLKPIDELPYIPIKHYPKQAEIVKQILERNNRTLRFWKTGFQLQEYQGAGLASIREKLNLYPFSGRVVIDPDMMRTTVPYHPLTLALGNLKKLRKYNRVWISDLMTEEEEPAVLQELLKDSKDFVSQIIQDTAENPRFMPRHSGHNMMKHVPGAIPYGAPAGVRLVPPGEPVGLPHDQSYSSSTAVPINIIITPEQLSKENILLVSGLLYGYSMQDGIWGAFALEKLSDISWNSHALDSLVLDETLKQTISKLVRVSNFGDSNFDDFIKGKGKGFISLLSGPPGSGKTLTAEAIAETAKMPLYTVSSGALGHEADAIHHHLTQILKLASHWKAVLLLDEADVFLAERKLTDIKRNAIVSIFLRELEYYQGILILTTNHADYIDKAFQSRIHLSLSYSAPDTDARRKIWENFIKATPNSQIEFKIEPEELDSLAKLPLNGREIKNSMSNAIRIAISSDFQVITASDLLANAKLSAAFAKVDRGGLFKMFKDFFGWLYQTIFK